MKTNIQTVGVPEGDEKEKGAKRLSEEIMTKDSTNLLKVINMNIQAAQHTTSRMNSEIHSNTH